MGEESLKFYRSIELVGFYGLMIETDLYLFKFYWSLF